MDSSCEICGAECCNAGLGMKREDMEPCGAWVPLNSRPEGYESLSAVLQDALAQAAEGKGAERHANGKPFEEQPIFVIQRLLIGHPLAGQAFQIIKKTIEAGRLYNIRGKEAAQHETYGAINYAAAMAKMFEELDMEAK